MLDAWHRGARTTAPTGSLSPFYPDMLPIVLWTYLVAIVEQDLGALRDLLVLTDALGNVQLHFLMCNSASTRKKAVIAAKKLVDKRNTIVQRKGRDGWQHEAEGVDIDMINTTDNSQTVVENDWLPSFLFLSLSVSCCGFSEMILIS